jgi:hypothetical protein
MGHKLVKADAEEAFARYVAATGDTGATLERLPNSVPAIYRMAGEFLRFEVVGAATTLYVLDAFNAGWRAHGRKVGPPLAGTT